MKHLPNLLTLANLFCGCIAATYILSAQPFLSNFASGVPYWDWVHGIQQLYLGSIFIGIAAICDVLDGLAARALGVHSPIGKDLDSLADVVSFGVAPSMILFKYLWDARMMDTNVTDVSILSMAPAFLIACFAALRLARFNITKENKNGFEGMPTPAVGLFIATLPLVEWYNPFGLAQYLKHPWVLYILIGVLCWLMVSRIKFIKLMPGKWTMAYVWPQIVLIVLTLAAIPVLKVAALPFAFILYIILSLIYRQPRTEEPAISINN